jgi:hypothetical protein
MYILTVKCIHLPLTLRFLNEQGVVSVTGQFVFRVPSETRVLRQLNRLSPPPTVE